MVLLRAAQKQQMKGIASDLHYYSADGSNFPAEKESIRKSTENNVEHGNIEEFYAAVDIGTTTLSIEMYNQNGKYLRGCAEDNAQGKLGSDVMMRLMHASEGRQDILCTLIRDQIYYQLGKLLADIREDADEIGNTNIEHVGQFDTAKKKSTTYPALTQLRRISVVGNTVMCHLFLDRDTAGLQGTPFQPAYKGSCRVFGKDLGWSDCPDVEIIVLPGIAAHVGADAAAVFMAEQLWKKDQIQLAVDLGTNAEIILNNRGKVYVCSAAAGSAFEGKGISCGCRGGTGAVSGVALNRANGNIILTLVPDAVTGKLIPKGICGSGLVDFIAELLKNKMLLPDGYLLSASEAREAGIPDSFVKRLEEENGEHCFLLYDPLLDKAVTSDRNQWKQLYLTQQDIRNFQLAKSAIRTGIAVLCRQSGIEVSQIEECRIAGVFGAFLHPEHAKASGLLPNLSSDRIHFVGNAAGRGAAQALFDPEWIPQLEKQIEGIYHVELAEQQEFQPLFLENMEIGQNF